MIRCAVTLDVARPVGEVFAFVDDVRNAPRWLGRCAGLVQTSTGEKGVGTTLQYTFREGAGTGTMRGAVAEYERDRRLAMRFTDTMFDVGVSFAFEPLGTGTRIAHAVEIRPKGFVGKLMTPIIRSATRQQIDRDTHKLRELLQANA
jgi:carbon monoxide dehydrogenase subunit G